MDYVNVLCTYINNASWGLTIDEMQFHYISDNELPSYK